MNSNPDIGTCLREGWALYTGRPWLLSGATVVVALINALASYIPLANLVTYPLLLAGLYILIMRLDAGEEVAIGNLFDGFSYFLPLVIASLLTSLLVALGILLFVIPGIYLAVTYGFTTLNIIDGNMEFWPAMENSRKTLTRHFWAYAGLGLILLLIILAGSLAFGVGLVVALPVCIAAQYRFYRRLQDDIPV
jgi:uncharacterized membrane protein